MKSIVAIVAFLGLVVLAVCRASTSREADWLLYKTQFGKCYINLQEDSMRKAIYTRNKAQVEKHNLLHARQLGYSKGINQFSDWTEDELNNLKDVQKPPSFNNSAKAEEFLRTLLNDDEPIPDQLDWRNRTGVVGPVKDSGKCGCSWAMATTGLLEGQELKQHRASKLIPLSDQELLDCSPKNNGCRGGNMIMALEDISDLAGIQDEDSYPFMFRKSENCRADRSRVVIETKGPASSKLSESDLKRVVARYGPVSVGFFASANFFTYSSGIFADESCPNNDDYNRAGVIVGYGTDKQDYWILVSTHPYNVAPCFAGFS